MVLKKLQLYSILLLTILSSCNNKPQVTISNNRNLSSLNTLIEKGHNHYKRGAFDSAYYYFNKVKNEAEHIKDTSRLVHSLSWMAQIQRNEGDYTGSEATAVEALPYLEKTDKFPNGKWNIYNQLGNNYLFTFDHQNAIFYFKKALLLKTDAIDIANMKNNIAYTYMDLGKFNEAIQILYPLSSQKIIQADPITYTRILDNLGYCYYKIGSTKSDYYLKKSLIKRREENDIRGLIVSYYHLAFNYHKTKPKLSEYYALLAYGDATKYRSIDDRLECLKLLIENAPENQSKKYSLLYLQLNDSITKVRQRAKNQYAKIKYDSKKEKDENLKLKEQKAQNLLQLEKQKKRTQLLYFLFAVLLFIFALIYYYIKNKNQREKIQVSYETELQIGKKLHDELANDLYQTMTFVETHDLSDQSNKDNLLYNLDTIYSRARNISQENGYIETGLNFNSHLKEVMSDFNTETTNIIINGLDTINWTLIDNTIKITVYRVIQELLVNMKKHSKSNLVVFSFEKNKDIMAIRYTDNGIGANLEALNLKNGLQNVENRIKAINGTIIFDTTSNRGFKVNISFPIK